MNRKKVTFVLLAVLIVFSVMLSFAGCDTGPVKIKALVVAKFETGEMSGDDKGEAQLFYEAYCSGACKYDLANGKCLYVNPANGVAVGVTGEGKANSASYYATVLSDERFDFSDAYILNTGCCGASYETAVLDDVILVTYAVDYDLGYEITPDNGINSSVKWIRNEAYDDFAMIEMDKELTESVYELVYDTDLSSTDNTGISGLSKLTGIEEVREPAVIKGVAVTSDSYWKGFSGHKRAVDIVDSYGIQDKYTATEMEDCACACTVKSYGMLDRFIDLRVAVNMDIIVPSSDTESTDVSDEEAVSSDIEPDVFITGMENLFAVGSRIIDAVLDGSLEKSLHS